MPPRKQSEFPARPNIDGTPPGHNSELSDDALIAENFQLEDQIKAATAKFNEWAKPRKERIAQIEADIRQRLLTRGADSTKTDSGTAYFSNIMTPKVENSPALFDFVADHWNDIGADAKISLPVATVKSHMENNEGNPPPGISVSFYKNLNIRRS